MRAYKIESATILMRLNSDAVIDGEADMTKTQQRARAFRCSLAAVLNRRGSGNASSDLDKAQRSEPHQNLGTTADVPTTATTLSEAAEIQAVATLTENLVTFTDQLSRAQRNTSLGLILMVPQCWVFTPSWGR